MEHAPMYVRAENPVGLTADDCRRARAQSVAS